MSGIKQPSSRARAIVLLGIGLMAGLWGCSESVRPDAVPAAAGDPGLHHAGLLEDITFEGLKLDNTLAEADTLVTKLVSGLVGGTVAGGEVVLDFAALSLPLVHEVQVVKLSPDHLVFDLRIDPYTAFLRPVPFTVYYGDYDLGPHPPYVVWYDEDAGEWVPLETVVDPAARTVQVQLEHFSLYGVTSEPPGDGTSGWGKAGTKESD